MVKELELMINIGKPDAQRLGIDETLAGKRVTPGSQEAYDEMVRQRWGLDPEEAAAERAATREVAAAAAPQIAAQQAAIQQAATQQAAPEQAPDFNAMTKEELKDFADRNQIPDVSMDLHKDEMVKVVKKATRNR